MYRGAFVHLWNSIHGPGAWERNDWVWVVGFEVKKTRRESSGQLEYGRRTG